MKKTTLSQAVVLALVTNNSGVTYRHQQIKVLSLREAKKQPQEFLLSESAAEALKTYCEAQKHPGLSVTIRPLQSTVSGTESDQDDEAAALEQAAADAAEKAAADKAAADAAEKAAADKAAKTISKAKG